MGCDHYRNTRLDLVFVLQFTIRQNLLMLFLDPLLAANKKHIIGISYITYHISL